MAVDLTMAKILVVEDDAVLADLVKQTLMADRHDVELAYTGEDGLLFLERFTFDLLVLDWELPGVSGVQLLSNYRQKGGMNPVIFVTARSSIEDKTESFNTGADDYLAKPFEMKELALRVQALLRRPRVREAETLTYRDIVVEPGKGRVQRAGRELRLQPRELALLEFFIKNQDLVFSSSQLIDRVWSFETEATDISVRSCIARIRRKLEVDDSEVFIENLRGLGYRLPADSTKKCE